MLRRDAAPTAGKSARRTPPLRTRQRALWFLLLCLACVIGLDALVGDRGVFALMRARQEHRELSTALANARVDNARLCEEARRLREEPAAIEELARRNLGLIKPGEFLVIVKDVRVPHQPQR